MLTPVDQPLDKLEDLTHEEMSVPSSCSPFDNADASVVRFLKREYEGLDRALHEQVYRLWAAS